MLLNTSWYIYNFRKNLILALIAKGYQVHAISPYDSYSSKLVDLGCEYHDFQFDSKSKNPFSDLSLVLRLRKILTDIQPDILLNFTIKPNVYGTIAAKRTNISCINNIAGMGTLFTENIFYRTLYKILFKFSQQSAKTVFFQNPDDFHELTRKNIVRKDIARLLPGSGVDLEEFPFTPPNEEKQEQIFLLVARMIYSKGIMELVNAADILTKKGYNNFHVQLLGEQGVNNPGAISESVMSSLNKKKHVTYLGKTDDVKSFIQKAHVIVLPSYYREGTPRSLLEALAIGRPIITTDMPGCRETVIHGSNGFICLPKSIESLADKMEQFLNMSSEEKKRFGRNSRKIAVSKFDEKIVIEEYLNAIQKLIGQ